MIVQHWPGLRPIGTAGVGDRRYFLKEYSRVYQLKQKEIVNHDTLPIEIINLKYPCDTFNETIKRLIIIRDIIIYTLVYAPLRKNKEG